MDFKHIPKKGGFYILLTVLVGVLFIANYTPNTFLIGWDNMMPEFNILLNVKRALTGVWQTYRGLGLYDGMSHIANLVHICMVGVLTWLLPLNLIRYVSIFFLYLLGGFGVMKLLRRLKTSNSVAFLAALFYLCNIGTIQQFFAPLEAFAFHFAALPWLFWAAIGYLEYKDKRRLLMFFITSFFFTPQSFVPTLFIAYLLGFGTLIVWDMENNKSIKSFCILVFITILANSFWLIPYTYGLKDNVSVIQNARINQFSSENVYLRNKARGDLLNVLKLKGFMLDVREYDSKDGKNIHFMAAWEKHTDGIFYNFLWTIVLCVVGLGIFKSAKKTKQRMFMLPLIVTFILLGTNAPFTSYINNQIHSYLPLLGEAFRFPFTKFITTFVFSLTLFFAFGLQELFIFYKKRQIALLPFFVICIYFILPAFQGKFFSPLLKREMPQDYFKIFDYFQKQPENGRIALLPANTYWSWQYRKWGQVGSGFLWFGIPQPILERAFDPWNNENEQFYNELSYAIKTQNVSALNILLEKYNITYILVDQYLVNNLTPKPIDYEKLRTFLDSNYQIRMVFKSGEIAVYKNAIQKKENGLRLDIPTVNTYARYYYEDPVFNDIGIYAAKNEAPDYIIPFANLFTEKLQSDREFNVVNDGANIIFTSPVLSDKSAPKQYQLILPNILLDQIVPAKIIQTRDSLVVELIRPRVSINGKEITIPSQFVEIPLQIKKLTTSYRLTENEQQFLNGNTFYLFQHFPNTLEVEFQDGDTELTHIDMSEFNDVVGDIAINIDSTSKMQISIPLASRYTKNEILSNQNWQEKDGKTEIAYYFGDVPYQTGYLITINSDWKSGLPLGFYVDSPYTYRNELESRLSKNSNFTNQFILPPNQLYGLGYGLHFSKESIGDEIAKTDIFDLAINPIPYEFMSGIRLKKTHVDTPKNYYILYQSFHEGWKAYVMPVESQKSKVKSLLQEAFPFLFGTEIKEHVLVNNWANGWELKSAETSSDQPSDSEGQLRPGNTNIVIIFWPQYLEYIGFVLLGITFFGILFWKQKK